MSGRFERIKRKPFMARLYRVLYPTYSTCVCCGLPWAVVKAHIIDMTECADEHCGRAFFPVCEWCWQNKSWLEISNAVVDLHKFWFLDGLEHDYEPPYTLADMLSKAQQEYKQSHNA